MTIGIRAQLAEIFRVDGERQWQQQEQEEEYNSHGEPPKNEEPLDSAYSPFGDQCKNHGSGSFHRYVFGTTMKPSAASP
jgi:hypothetical protein